MDKIQAQLAEAMASHNMDFTYDGKKTGCSCGHWQDRGPVSAEVDHSDHLADVSAPIVKALLMAQLKTFADLAEAHDRGRGGCVCPLCLAVAESGIAPAELSEAAPALSPGGADQPNSSRVRKLRALLRTSEARLRRVEQLAQRFEDVFGHSGLAELIRRELRDSDV